MDNGLLRVRQPILCGLSAAVCGIGGFLCCSSVVAQGISLRLWIFSVLPTLLLGVALALCVALSARNYAVVLAPVYCFFALLWADSFGLGIVIGSGEAYAEFLRNATPSTWVLAALFCLLDFLCLFSFAAADRSLFWKRSHITASLTAIGAIAVCRIFFGSVCAAVLPNLGAHIAVLAMLLLLTLSIGRPSHDDEPYRVRIAALFGMATGGVICAAGGWYLFRMVAPGRGFASTDAVIAYAVIVLGISVTVLSACRVKDKDVTAADWQNLLDDDLPDRYNSQNRTGLTEQFNAVPEDRKNEDVEDGATADDLNLDFFDFDDEDDTGYAVNPLEDDFLSPDEKKTDDADEPIEFYDLPDIGSIPDEPIESEADETQGPSESKDPQEDIYTSLLARLDSLKREVPDHKETKR